MGFHPSKARLQVNCSPSLGPPQGAHSTELRNKWIDSLTKIATEKYGVDAPFAIWMKEARPFLLFVNDMRNMIEHPKSNSRIAIHNFSLNTKAEIELPYLEIVRPTDQPEKASYETRR
jgi:hypothetical protein